MTLGYDAPMHDMVVRLKSLVEIRGPERKSAKDNDTLAPYNTIQYESSRSTAQHTFFSCERAFSETRRGIDVEEEKEEYEHTSPSHSHVTERPLALRSCAECIKDARARRGVEGVWVCGERPPPNPLEETGMRGMDLPRERERMCVCVLMI